ncbi:hypothetical protein PG991_012270 [Apiospora marii]|uniref:Uncharacterized protein n=1 Tax=Apiospora marii TaxID=335849 RepID=A0ABR1R989_9PEZI
MAGPNENCAERFRLCYFADAYYGSRPSWPAENAPPTVIEVPHDPDSRFVLTLEIQTSLSAPDAESPFCIDESATEDEAKPALTGYIDAAFVLTERAPIEPGGDLSSGSYAVTTGATHSQQLAHYHYHTDYADLVSELSEEGGPEFVARGLVIAGESDEPSVDDKAAVVGHVGTILSGVLGQAIGKPGEEDTGEVVGSTSADVLKRDLGAALENFTYETYLDATSGAIAQVQDLSQDYEKQYRVAPGASRYSQRNRLAKRET